jgi:hypothetical protein
METRIDHAEISQFFDVDEQTGGPPPIPEKGEADRRDIVHGL